MDENKIKWKSLTDYLDNPEAPPGYAYFINNSPAVQIDLFEKYYTLFWLGVVEAETFVNGFLDVLNEVKPPRRWFRPKPVFMGSVSVVKKQEISNPLQPSQRYVLVSESHDLKLPYSASNTYLRKHFNLIVQLNDPTITAIKIDARTNYQTKDYQLSLWADTMESLKREKEVGITTSFPLTKSSIDLLTRTSHAVKGLQESELNYLIKMIRSNINEGGYLGNEL